MACGKVLKWDKRRDRVFGEPHEHVCGLEADHPVSDGSGVQCHECAQPGCTLAWESDRRPLHDGRDIRQWKP
jgi:hypothetical protein